MKFVLSLIGWITVVVLGISILYSGIFHSRNYSQMSTRAYFARESGDPMAPHLERLASQYMWRTIAMQVFKTILIIIICNFIL